MGYWPVVKRVVKDSDIVLLVGDVRMPELSRNKTLERMIALHDKKLVRVFTKIDLVSVSYLKSVKSKHKGVIFVSGLKNIGVARLKKKLFIISKRMGIKDIRIGVVGYPNVGKSAIINALAKREKAKVSKKAGTTKGIQWIRAGSLFILDSPGVVPFEDNEVRLGILGSKNPEKLNNVERVALEIIKMIVDYDRKILEARYDLSLTEDYDLVLEEIGRKKGFLLKGARVDVRRSALLIIKDWQKGELRL